MREGFGKENSNGGLPFLQCSGKVIYPDGRIYEGKFDHFKLHGFGKMSFPDGEIREGEFIENRLLKGKIIKHTGEIIEGRFKNNLVQDHRYHDYVLEGHGKRVFPNGKIWQGPFVDNRHLA